MKILRILPIIGIAIFIYVIYTSGVGQIYDALIHINPVYIVLALSILVPRTLLYVKKWDIVLKKQDIHLPFMYIMKAYFIGVFYGAITPGWLGTYIRIPYVMKKAKISLGKSTSNLVIDTLIDFISVLMLGMSGTVLIFQYFPQLLPASITVFGVILFLSLYLKNKKRSEKLFRLVVKLLIPMKYKESITQQFDDFYERIPRIRELLLPILLAVICWILSYTQIYIIAQALNINLPYVYFIMVYPLVFLVELIPVSVSGLGTREVALIGLFSVFGIASGKIVILSLLGYLITIIAPAVIGLPISLMRIEKE